MKEHPNASGARSARTALVLFAAGALIVVCFLISVNTGYIRLGPPEALRTLLGFGTDSQELILFQFRLPRIVIALLVGAGLAVSGAVLQGLTRNALADPGLLGINTGAGFAVVCFLSLYQVQDRAPVQWLPPLAFAGGMLTATVIYLLAYRKYEGFTPTRLILVGIAVAAGIGALMLVVTVRLNAFNLQFAAIWLAGSIWGSNWLFVKSLRRG